MGKTRDAVHCPILSCPISSRPEADTGNLWWKIDNTAQLQPTSPDKSKPFKLWPRVSRRDREGVEKAQMRSSLLPSAKGNCRMEMKHPAPSPRRIAFYGQGRVKQPRGPAGQAAYVCKKDVQNVAFGSLNRDELQLASLPSPRPRPAAAECNPGPSVSRRLAAIRTRHGLRACPSSVSASLQTRRKCAAT